MKNQVKAFLPVDITDAMLVNSTIAEPDVNEPEWDSTTTFAEDALVSVITADSHLVYQSLQAGNLNHPPATSSTWWILKSNTNRFRMFNWYQGSPSVGQSPMTVVIRPGKRINAMVLEGLKASGIEVSIRDGLSGPVVYTIDGWLLSRHVSTFYEYFYAPFVYDRIVSAFDIPPVPDPVITVTLTDSSGLCELGRFGVGLAMGIGYVDWDSVSEDGSYSEIDYDKSGMPTLRPNIAPASLEMQLELDVSRINAVAQFKKNINGKPVFWSAMEQIEAYSQMHVMVGIPERFRITSDNHKFARVDLRLIGI